MSDALNLARPDTSLLRTVARQGGRDIGLERNQEQSEPDDSRPLEIRALLGLMPALPMLRSTVATSSPGRIGFLNSLWRSAAPPGNPNG